MARLPIILVLLAFAAAGCLGQGGEPGAGDNANRVSILSGVPHAEAPAFDDVLLPEPGIGAEPMVAVGPDEALYVAAPAIVGQVSHSLLWRSADRGATWESLGAVAKACGSQDDDIAVAPDGALWMVNYPTYNCVTDGRTAHTCMAVSRSVDGGASWFTNPLSCTVPVPSAAGVYQDRPWLAAGATGATLVYADFLEGPSGTAGAVARSLYVAARSADNVAWSWQPLDFLPNFARVGRIHDDGQGLLTLPYAERAFEEGEISARGPFLATSRDGMTWDVEPVASARVNDRWVQWATSGDQAAAAWIGSEAGRDDWNVQAMLRGPDGWGEPLLLDGDGSNAFLWAAGTPGHLLLLWLHADEPGHPSELGDQAQWRLRLWRDGTVLEVPTPIHRGPLFVGWDVAAAEGTRTIGDFISGAVLADGRAIVATPIDTVGDPGYWQAPLHVFVIEP